MPRTQLAIVALVVGFGCQGKATAGSVPAPTEAPGARFEADMITRFHMRGNFDLVRGIERLLIAGKLAPAQAFARALADQPMPPELERWTKQLSRVRLRAATVAAASNLADACRRVAALDEACAGCHADASAQPEFADPPPLPIDTSTIPARMARHRWATERLWEGMVGDSDGDWQAGLEVLAATPLAPADLGEGRVELAKDLQQRAGDGLRAAKVEDRSQRARRYGEILVACVACHATATTTE